MSIRDHKQGLRRVLLERRAAIPADAAAFAAERVAQHVAALPGLTAGHTVAIYRAVRDELDTSPLERALDVAGATLAYPRVAGTRLAFHATRELHPARYGLLEPAASAPELLLPHIDVFVVPALGFDRRGARLGYGKGFYDTALAAAPRALRIGVAYDCQIVHEIPEHAGDQRVDVIVTETGARWTGARPGRMGT